MCGSKKLRLWKFFFLPNWEWLFSHRLQKYDQQLNQILLNFPHQFQILCQWCRWFYSESLRRQRLVQHELNYLKQAAENKQRELLYFPNTLNTHPNLGELTVQFLKFVRFLNVPFKINFQVSFMISLTCTWDMHVNFGSNLKLLVHGVH